MKVRNKLSLFGFDFELVDPSAQIAKILCAEHPATMMCVSTQEIKGARRDANLEQALIAKDAVIPTGRLLSAAIAMMGCQVDGKTDLKNVLHAVCVGAVEHGRKIFFVARAPDIAKRTMEAARQLAPKIEIAGSAVGELGPTAADAIVQRVNAAGAGIVVLVGGTPAQEIWLTANRHKINAQLVFQMSDEVVSRERRKGALLSHMGNAWLLGKTAGLALRHHARSLTSHDGLKRGLDIIVAGSAIMALSPLLALVALAIRLETEGPILFKQTRIGLHGVPFTMFKFRSMHQNTGAQSPIPASDRAGVCFKAKKDPRITRVGRLLRRTSVDELPQLFNVLSGKMSLVGPRPALPREVTEYPARALGRLAAKPGITGMWQVAGRADIGFDKMVDMDLAYVRARSLALDIVLLAMTVRAVISGRGAY